MTDANLGFRNRYLTARPTLHTDGEGIEPPQVLPWPSLSKRAPYRSGNHPINRGFPPHRRHTNHRDHPIACLLPDRLTDRHDHKHDTYTPPYRTLSCLPSHPGRSNFWCHIWDTKFCTMFPSIRCDHLMRNPSACGGSISRSVFHGNNINRLISIQ